MSVLEWSESRIASRPGDAASMWLIAGAMSFNFVLSMVNAHGFGISSIHVQIVQLAITGLGLLLVVARGGPDTPLAFPLLVVAFLVFSGISMLATGSFDFKTIYDVLLLATFIALGSTLWQLPVRYLNWLLGLAAIVAGFEYFLPDLYTRLVDPLSYFANTRAWVAAALGDTFTDGAGLAISTIRGGGESWLGLSIGGHRVGGIFLEPLSQGYFAAILAMFYCFHFQDDFWRRSLACFICLMLAFISDTRVAVLLIGFCFVAGPLVRRLPALLAYLVPVVGLLAGIVVFAGMSVSDDSSELAFRMSLTFRTLLQSPLYNVLFGGLDLTYAADSGIVTVMAQSGLAGLMSFFVMASGLGSMRRREPMVLFLVTTYLFVTAMFGAAFLSIKTAALLGLLIGAVGTGAFAPGFSARSR